MSAEDAVIAWREASTDLGIRVEAPYVIARDEHRVSCIAFVPDFGARGGIVVRSTTDVDDGSLHSLIDAWVSLSPDIFESYDRHQWIDMLERLRWFGSEAPPAWYTAISPWHNDARVMTAVRDELSRIFGHDVPVERSAVYRELDLLPGEELLAFLGRVPTGGVTRQSFWRWVTDFAEEWNYRHPRPSAADR